MLERDSHQRVPSVPLSLQRASQRVTGRHYGAGPERHERRGLTKQEVVAIRDAMRGLVESDLARGRTAEGRQY
jgi:hypothetical protein